MPFSVPWEEMHGSPRETVGRDGFTAERRLRCAWADRLTLHYELMQGGGHLYPHAPIAARCINVTSEAVGQLKQGAADGETGFLSDYEQCDVVATYETPRSNLALINANPSEPGGIELVSEDIYQQVSALIMPASPNLYHQLGSPTRPLTAEERPGLFKYTMSYTLVRHQLTTIPAGTLSLANRCNQQPFTAKILPITFQPETLMCLGAKVRVVANNAGARRYTIEYSFSAFAEGWNTSPYWSAGGFLVWSPLVTFEGTRVRWVPMANFSNI